MEGKRIITVLEEQDEFPHEPDDVTNYNESMYLNTFDLDQEIGGWFRLGNRVNEGYAEMTVVCISPTGKLALCTTDQNYNKYRDECRRPPNKCRRTL